MLNKEITKLRSQKRRLDERIAKQEEAGKQSQSKKLKSKLGGIKRKISVRINKREQLPKKVLMMDRIAEEKIVRLADGKKLFFDWLKMNGIWAKRKLVEIVKPYYKDLRDVNKFVRSILRSRTYVARKDDTMYVSFPPQRSTNGKIALEAFCRYLNSMKPIDLDLSLCSIHFRVGRKH